MRHKSRTLFLKILFLSLLTASSFYALALKSEYSIEDLDFNASTVDPLLTNDFLIYRFDTNRHKKTFTSSRLIKTFEEHGIELEDKSRGIVHVRRSSSVQFGPILRKIKDHYHHYFPDMHIEDISIRPSSFIDVLPQHYELIFKPNAHLHSRSSFKIFSKEEKTSYFISYEIQAKMKLFKARHNINRGKILTRKDLLYADETLERFLDLPVEVISQAPVRLKKRLVEGNILYQDDIELIPSVLKNMPVNVRFISGKVHLEFQATSLDDAGTGEYIYIKKTDGKRLKAKVIGKNLVEIE